MANISPYESLSIDDTLKKLNSSKDEGLASAEAKKRLEQYGPNALDEKEESLFKKLFAYFWGPIPWMIEIAGLLSGLLKRWPDLIVIASMLLINALLGFFQEYKAGNAIKALKAKLALKARVLRGSKWLDIAAKELVPGDIIQIEIGNIIPADIKLIDGQYLSVDQSSLTGESLPVDKKVGDMAYSGTTAKMGSMKGIVTDTGMDTFFGKTAKLVKEASPVSHFQKTILSIGNFLISLTLIICAIILVVSLYRMKVTHNIHEDIGSIVIFILVLVVAGIPVAQPAVLSATMAIGANRLASMKAIVSKLTAIEELANMEVLCSDKTGTLTKNQLTVGQSALIEGKSEEDLMLYAALASNIDHPDAIDHCIIESLKNKEELKKYKVQKFLPFDPVSKKTESTISMDNSTFEVSKGAPQVILELCSSKDTLKDKVNKLIDDFASKGYRTLGVAKKENNNWIYLGMIPLFDPPRKDTKATLEEVKTMGVSVKMVTGDHEAIAKQLASELDLGTNIVSVSHLKEMVQHGENPDRLLTEADGFSEVFPEHKFRIVKAFQSHHHITGMTGDGVNDAPALKQADVGIAVSGATDAAKQAADLILTKPGLNVIAKAIEEARRIFGRMKSYNMYRISETCRLLLFLCLSMIVFNDHPLTAIMIILIALLNDIPIMMIAYDHMHVPNKPTHWNMKEMFTIALGLAVVGVISTFGLFWIGEQYWFNSVQDPSQKFYLLRTLAFMGILCGGNLTIYITRNRGTIWQTPLPEWKFFLATFASLVVGTLVSVYGLGTSDFVGIGWKYVIYSWIYILIWFVICMFVKEGLYRLLGEDLNYQDPIDSK